MKKRIGFFGIGVLVIGLLMTGCSTDGGGGGGGSGLFLSLGMASGEWFTFDDRGTPNNGSSTIAMTETVQDGMTALDLSGNVTDTFEWGHAGFGLGPDEETSEKLRNMTAISFMVWGNGLRYTIRIETSNVTDFGFFSYTFNTNQNNPVRVTIPMENFRQPTWANPAIRDQNLITNLSWQNLETNVPSRFELIIWDIQLYGLE